MIFLSHVLVQNCTQISTKMLGTQIQWKQIFIMLDGLLIEELREGGLKFFKKKEYKNM